MLAECGADAVFLPETTDIYPRGFETMVQVEKLSNVVEGLSRPGHFKGVTTIVLILFNIISPHAAYFGRKDAQQARIISQMVQDLKIPVNIRICPIVREVDGLAMSSRNVYLNQAQRSQASILYTSLELAKKLINEGERASQTIISAMINEIQSMPEADLTYVEIVDNEKFIRTAELAAGFSYYILIACRFGKTRLIDNCFFTFNADGKPEFQ
jgi:pantoate--beta-alanine ligase